MGIDDALMQLTNSEKLPLKLPIVHMTTTRRLNEILENGYLKPKMCKVFNREIVFFFYGGAFYRYRGVQKNIDVNDLYPVAFMFSPKTANIINSYYPFDTGGAFYRHYGKSWSEKLKDFSKYEMKGLKSGTPEKYIHSIFGSNIDYLKGNVRNDIQQLPLPLPELVEFHKADIDDLHEGFERPDKRRSMIECQSSESLSLKDHIIEWIAMPEELEDKAFKIREQIFEHQGRMPDYYLYSYHRHDPLQEIAAKIEENCFKNLKTRKYL